MVSNEDSGYSLALGGFAYDCFDRLWTSVCINPYIHSDVSYAHTQNGSLFRYADSMKDNSFSALFRDLAIFFGSILGFVAGFLLFSWLLPPSRDPYLFWPLFLAFLFLFSRLIKCALSKKRRGSR
jgi:hypothetical protein